MPTAGSPSDTRLLVSAYVISYPDFSASLLHYITAVYFLCIFKSLSKHVVFVPLVSSSEGFVHWDKIFWPILHLYIYRFIVFYSIIKLQCIFWPIHH
jgi:hypothetical protein